MNRFHLYLKQSADLINRYPSGTPLSHYLKAHFKKNPTLGSRDRKTISALCYAYFRCSHCFSSNTDFETQLLVSLFLVEQKTQPILEALKPEWKQQITLSFEEKWKWVEASTTPLPGFSSFISSEININDYIQSLYVQPKVFIRIRPSKKKRILEQLKEQEISYQVCDEFTLAFEPGVALDKWNGINRDFVVQDLSSQKVFHDLPALPDRAAVWDCCAASGGKSILLHDQCKQNIQLSVSDIRKHMLQNLRLRLSAAGVPIYHLFAADLTATSGLSTDTIFDAIICDVPCSGSGTWARTPEQMYEFDQAKLRMHTIRQRAILDQVVPHLKPDGQLIYITCSVFAEENELQIQYLEQKHNLQCIGMRYHVGFDQRADTLFSAVMKPKIRY